MVKRIYEGIDEEGRFVVGYKLTPKGTHRSKKIEFQRRIENVC